MFAELAPRIRGKGWRSIIPILAGLKRPAISGWNAYNTRPPSDMEIAKWACLYGDGGIGLAFGPDRVVGIDLDWLEPLLVARAWQITRDILGETPLIRIGRPPKRLAIYRCATGLIVDGKVFDGFEIFSRSGQCVLFGIHPETRQPYRWLTETPETIAPLDLPLAGSEQIVALIGALMRVDPRTARPRTGTARPAKPGIAARILRVLQDVEDAPAEAARILAAAPHGRRHNTMVGTTLALAMRGYSDAAIFDALDDAYYLVNDLSIEEASQEVSNAIRWARECVGPDDATITGIMAPALESIAAAWNRRWGRP